MDDPWKTAPQKLEERVEAYVQKACKSGIDPALLRRYAKILIAADVVVASRLQSEQETRDEVARKAADEHGVWTRDPQEARTAFAAARKAQQEVYGSSKSCSDKLKRFLSLLGPRHRLLPVDPGWAFPIERITAACNVIHEFSNAIRPRADNISEVKFAKSELSLTREGQTFLWWRLLVPQYKGRWSDMYALARCWRLTDAKNREGFKRSVRKAKAVPCEGGPRILGCPPWALL